MNYSKEKQSLLEKNKFVIRVMMLYIDDYEFLYQCIGIDSDDVIFEVEELIVNLVDFQGDCVHYSPLSLA